ncbi:MAG TPA: hypothetical protein VF395_19965, partial [Polyangiaceae bacterium]
MAGETAGVYSRGLEDSKVVPTRGLAQLASVAIFTTAVAHGSVARGETAPLAVTASATPAPERPDPHPALVSYRAPLAAWYGVALASTWIPVLIASDCVGVSCLNLLWGPALRIGTSFGPAIVHFNWRRIGRGFLSLGGQVAALAVGVSVGSAVHPARDCPGEESCSPNFGPFVAWFIADAVWATLEIVTTPASVSRVPPSTLASVAPGLRLVRGGASFELGG